MLKKILLGCIRLYQATLSPNKGRFRHILAQRICAHQPHCSEYGHQCIHHYGVRKGIQYATQRVLSCTPSHTMQYDPSRYRVVFFGSAPISVPFLQGLADDPRYEVVGVVTMPDQPSGRGMKMQANIVKTMALQQNIVSEAYIATPLSLRLNSKKYSKQAEIFKKRIEDIQPDLCIVVAYGNIIPPWLLDLPHFGCINVHGSLLPKYRGASPLQDIFLQGETETGLTIMQMDAGVDTGNIMQLLATKIPLSRTVKSLIEWIKHEGPRFLQDTLWSFLKGEIVSRPQDNNLSTGCSKIAKEDGYIDIDIDSIEHIYNKRRAYYLWPKTSFLWKRNGKDDIRVTIEEISIDEDIYMQSGKTELLCNDIYMLHPCIQHLIVKPEGKKSIAWEEFLRGYMK